jgi:tetratricopeptide (TPR) repeat protein
MRRTVAIAWICMAAGCTPLPEPPPAEATPSLEDQRLDPLKIGPELIEARETPGNLERAITLFRWHLKQRPGSVDLNALLAEAHSRSCEALDLKKPEDRPRHLEHRTEGLRQAREAVRMDPGHAPAHYWLAALLLHAADAESSLAKAKEAIIHLNTADQLSPAIDDGGPSRLGGRLLQDMPGIVGGSYPKAIASYRRSLELAPAFLTTHLWLGQAYLETNRPDLARKELEWVAAAKLRKGHEKEDGDDKHKALELLKKLDGK